MTSRGSSDGGSSASPHDSGSVPHDLRMDGATDAVMQFDIDLGKDILLVDGLFTNISQGCCFYYISNDKLLDGFVFGHTTGTVGTSEEFYVSTSVLVTSSITPFLGHDYPKK